VHALTFGGIKVIKSSSRCRITFYNFRYSTWSLLLVSMCMQQSYLQNLNQDVCW